MEMSTQPRSQAGSQPGTTPSTQQHGMTDVVAGGRKPDWTDLVFLVLLACGAAFALHQVGDHMDYYDKAILFGAVPALAWLGWLWRPMRTLMVVVALSTGLAIVAYQGSAVRAEQSFFLKYLLSSQSAILWMCAAFCIAMACYWLGLLARWKTASWLGTVFSWTAVFFGVTGLLVRWHESYLLGADVGHIPVSNLYEVIVLFCMVTALFYLYYEQKYGTRSLGGFVSLVITAAVAFLLWYSFDRGAHEIQPLVPALQSWWMKLHVPANFIGYGTFSLAAMVAFAYLVKIHGDTSSWKKLTPLFLLGVLLAAEPLVFRGSQTSAYWMVYFGVAAVAVGGILFARRRIAVHLPSLEVLDDIMYKAIAVGFAFFTVATVLGALWAADAWGAYWQWDPKETWALIVWLNYAAWLHMRLMKGLRGAASAYWALVGLLITGFAFLGVNMFLSGLHSYGEL